MFTKAGSRGKPQKEATSCSQHPSVDSEPSRSSRSRAPGPCRSPQRFCSRSWWSRDSSSGGSTRPTGAGAQGPTFVDPPSGLSATTPRSGPPDVRRREARRARGNPRALLDGADGNRTHDPHVANVVLSQLSYCPAAIRTDESGESGLATPPEPFNRVNGSRVVPAPPPAPCIRCRGS